MRLDQAAHPALRLADLAACLFGEGLAVLGIACAGQSRSRTGDRAEAPPWAYRFPAHLTRPIRKSQGGLLGPRWPSTHRGIVTRLRTKALLWFPRWRCEHRAALGARDLAAGFAVINATTGVRAVFGTQHWTAYSFAADRACPNGYGRRRIAVILPRRNVGGYLALQRSILGLAQYSQRQGKLRRRGLQHCGLLSVLPQPALDLDVLRAVYEKIGRVGGRAAIGEGEQHVVRLIVKRVAAGQQEAGIVRLPSRTEVAAQVGPQATDAIGIAAGHLPAQRGRLTFSTGGPAGSRAPAPRTRRWCIEQRAAALAGRILARMTLLIRLNSDSHSTGGTKMVASRSCRFDFNRHPTACTVVDCPSPCAFSPRPVGARAVTEAPAALPLEERAAAFAHQLYHPHIIA